MKSEGRLSSHEAETKFAEQFVADLVLPSSLHRFEHELKKAAGATVAEVKLPASFARIHEVGQLVMEVEAATYHAEAFHRHRADYGQGIGAAVQAGLARPATAYVEANRARLAFRDDVMPLLGGADALLSPTAPTVAPAGLGSTGDPSLCGPWSFAGVPAISLPSGVASSGLPHAIQLVAAAGRDAHLLGVAAWCERVLGFTATPAF